jgi:hypothetical protein
MINCLEIGIYLLFGIWLLEFIMGGNSIMSTEHEKLKQTTLYLEEEVLDALEELAEEYSKETGQKWSKGAVVRVALSEFFTRRGKIL